jgi:peptide/nickel transport system substrate-binding protein
MRLRRLPRLGVAGCLLLTLATAGCRRPPPPDVPLRIAHESEALSFDPTLLPETATMSVLGNFYEGLVRLDADNRMLPALAESWLTVDTHTWLFKIRPGVRFHDGSPLTARDVKESLERALHEPSSGVKGYLSAISEVAVDGEAVRIRTSRPDPLLLSRLSWVFITPHGRGQQGFERPVGTGPYEFLGRRDGEIEAAAFPQYWNGPPRIRRVRFVTVPAGEVVKALRSGSVDILRWVPEVALPEIRAVPGFQVVTSEGLSAYYLWFSGEGRLSGQANPFVDPRVRRAVSRAIDRQALVAPMAGLALPLTQLVHHGIFGYAPELPPLPHDPDSARRLLAESGYPDGFTTTLCFRDDADLEPVAATLQAMLAEVGIRLELHPLPWKAMLDQAWIERQDPLFLAGWQFDEGDAWGFLRDCIYTQDPTRTYGAYNPGFSSGEMDRLIDQGDQIFDRLERRAHYQAIMRLAQDEMPLVPLYARKDTYAVATRLRWRPRIDGNLRAAEMSWK